MCSKCILSTKRFTGWLVQRCHSFPGRSECSCWHVVSSLWHRCQPKLHNSIWLVCWNVFIIDVIKTIRNPLQHSVRLVAFKLGSVFFASMALHDFEEIISICSSVRNNKIIWVIELKVINIDIQCVSEKTVSAEFRFLKKNPKTDRFTSFTLSLVL